MNLKFSKTLVMFLIIQNLFAQKGNFEKGYFIDIQNNKIECLIKNENWDYSPTQFEYKKDENSKINTVSISEFSEFNVQEYKFIKKNVKIDKSKDKIEEADVEGNSKALKLQEENLLLRVLTEGKATLYSYRTPEFSRYFYSIDKGPINQLSFKVYYDNDLKGFRNNENYKQELLNNLICSTITQNDVDKLEYKTTNMISIFDKFNVCSGGDKTVFQSKKNVNTFEIYGKLGLSKASFSSNFIGNESKFSDKFLFRVGAEGEINLSTKSKNWSVLLEALYHNYNNSYSNESKNISIDLVYKSLDFSLGIRKYFKVNDKILFFGDAYYTFAYYLGTDINYFNNGINQKYYFKINRFVVNPSIGIGALINKRFIIDVRYEFTKNIFVQYDENESTYTLLTLNFGYKFL